MKWLGLEDWLNQQKGPVTKQQVQDYIRANQIEVKEVQKGKASSDIDDWHQADTVDRPDGGTETWMTRSGEPDEAGGTGIMAQHNAGGELVNFEAFSNGDTLGRFTNFSEAANAVAQSSRGVEGSTKFAGYQLPGGENYRELLLTLPPEVGPKSAEANDLMRRLNAGEFNHLNDQERGVLWGKLENLNQEKNKEAIANTPFKSPHWDEPNVLAHIRFNDRTIDGKKTLFIEEIQSDWHQAGKRKGYVGQDKTTRTVAEIDRNMDANLLELDRREGEREDADLAAQQAWARNPDLQARHDELMRERNAAAGIVTGVPDAPFKTTWPELSLKRMIRYAAENGYDQVAWTPGHVQADRYDLSKQVKALHVSRDVVNGNFHIEADTTTGHADIAHNVEPSKLEDYVGKDIARRIVDDFSKRLAAPKSYQGLDLKVGGEGMSGFYDKILPAAANKLVKKYGVKVGESRLTEGERGEIYGWEGGPFYGNARNRNEIENARAAGAFVKPDVQAISVHTLPITPALRRAALVSGFPQFKWGGAVFARANGGRVNSAAIESNPTEAQKQAGNYAKDHVNIHGLDITIENAKGQTRSGVDKGGKPWSVKMPAHYGYIKGTVGKDKDHVDVYLGPHRKSPHVFVIDQMNAETGRFDEHKVFLGFAAKGHVVTTYRKAFSDGRADERLGHMQKMTVDQFKHWLERGDTTKPIQSVARHIGAAA